MRLVRMPFIAPFGRDDLPDVLGGEAKVPGLLNGHRVA
jgi:hypothetical protein